MPIFPLGETPAPDEMRITFLGTSCSPRLAQECNSVFVETGSGTEARIIPNLKKKTVLLHENVLQLFRLTVILCKNAAHKFD